MTAERHYAVVLAGGREVVVSIHPEEDIDIVLSEQFTAAEPDAVEFYVELTPDDPEYPGHAAGPQAPATR